MENDKPEIYTEEDIISAYRKFKNYIYYSSTNLFYRKQVVEFESNDKDNNRGNSISEKLKKLTSLINSKDFSAKEYTDKIKLFAIPKSIKRGDNEDPDENLFHNVQSLESEINGKTHLIDVPIEIHIISTLWVLKNGYSYQKKYKKYNYGNILIPEESLKDNGLRLFELYFHNYQRWRDEAINDTVEEVKKGHDTLILGLDVTNFYNTVRISKNDYCKNNTDKIGTFLFEISVMYYKKYFDEKYFDEKNQKVGLPIGLLSSSILANEYLRNFDEYVVEELSPIYYGRYVDDILIVLRVNKKLITVKEINDHIEKNLLKITDKDNNDENKYKLRKVENLYIQEKKIIKYYFDANEPTTLLKEFIKELKDNSSEFRFLPENLNSSTAYSIEYAGSKNKLRNITKFSIDKFNVSKFLAKQIFNSLSIEKKQNIVVRDEILSLFKSQRALSLYDYWEKSLTYFVITDDLQSINKIISNIKLAIKNINKEGNKDIIRTLNTILDASIGFSFALNSKISNKYNDEIKDLPKNTLIANMVRYKHIAYPFQQSLNYDAINLTLPKYEFGNVKCLDIKDIEKGNKKDKTLNFREIFCEDTFKFNPRYIPFHEVVFFYIQCYIFCYKDFPLNYLNESFKLFYQINYLRTFDKISDDDNKFKSLKHKYFNEIQSIEKVKNIEIKNIEIPTKINKDKIKIALGNIKIDEKEVYQNLINQPVVSEHRKNKIFSMINQTIKDGNVDFLVLPEASIPLRWFNLISETIRKEKIAMIFGLEYLLSDGKAFNLIVNLLPLDMSSNPKDYFYVEVIPIIRVKNHYAPSEIEGIEGYHHIVPKIDKSIYHLIKWRNIYFTTFNCFELTAILERGMFRSLIDVLFVCEFNADVNYYSNLVESTSRDLHCYLIQSNSADYGDSRITQPTKTVKKDILRIKGGINPTVLIENINIESLRKFQYKRWNLQLNDKSYKPTPSGFNRDEVAKRLNISNIKTKNE
jgi:hypothetical protein